MHSHILNNSKNESRNHDYYNTKVYRNVSYASFQMHSQVLKPQIFRILAYTKVYTITHGHKGLHLKD